MSAGPGVEVRPIAPRERDAVLDLLAEWLGDREFFARYMRHDPSFRDDLCFVGVDRGRIVSTLQVFRRTVRLAAGVVDVAAVGNVFTTAAYREHGLATTLLEHALAAMPAHGFDMSMLFATRLAFYGRLGWRSHVRHLVFLPRGCGTGGGPYRVDRFQPADLDAVVAIYDGHTGQRVGTTVRSPAYWRGQLRFAGNPSEDFVVARDGTQIVAYARGIELFGLYVVMEHAYAPGHHRALAQLVSEVHHSTAASYPGTLTQLSDDSLVLTELRRRGMELSTVEDVFWLWRIIDPGRVALAAGLPEEAVHADDALFTVLPPDRSVYWISDRF